MSNPRKIVFRNEYVYHICNRAIEGRQIFTSIRDYDRAFMLLRFYRHKSLPMRLSHFLQLSSAIQKETLQRISVQPQIINILAFALMPNHFHLLIRQEMDGGITKYVSNFSNAYARYFNTKYKRLGPVFQGPFRAVFIEDDNQLVHVSRYIHLNPVVASLIAYHNLKKYRWTSFLEYVEERTGSFVATEQVLAQFSTKEKYENFVVDHVGYARELHSIKHLAIE